MAHPRKMKKAMASTIPDYSSEEHDAHSYLLTLPTTGAKNLLLRLGGRYKV